MAESHNANICKEFLTELNTYRKKFGDKNDPAHGGWTKVQNGVDAFSDAKGLEVYKNTKTPCWRLEVNASGAESWIYTSPVDKLAAEKKAGKVGTDGRAIVKFVGHDQDDFVSVKDFVERGELAFDSVKDEYGYEDKNKQAEFENELNKLKDIFINNIKQYVLNESKMLGSNKVQYYKKQREKALAEIGEFTVAMAKLIQRRDRYQHPLKEIIAEIGEAEKHYVAKRGRPAYIKIGKFTANGPTMLSAQFPQGEKTLPSTLRSRDLPPVSQDDNEVKMTTLSTPMLSNHVVDFTAEVLDDNSVVPCVEVIGHSSYPPISVKDELTRRYLAYRAVEENIIAIAANKLKDNAANTVSKKPAPKKTDVINGNDNSEWSEEGSDPDKDDDSLTDSEIEDKHGLGSIDDPIKISLSSMMLMTPSINKFIDGKLRGVESEVAQVSESAMSLDMMHYIHGGQPFAVIIDGERKYVTVDISCMNVPVNQTEMGHNAFTEKNLILTNALQKRTNARGFYNYFDKIEESLKDRIKNNKISSEIFAIFNGTKMELTGKVDELFEKDDDLKEAVSNLKSFKGDLEPTIKGAHESCLKLLEKYVASAKKEKEGKNPKDREKYNNKKNIAETEYKRLRKLIVESEEKIAEYYEKVHDCRKKIFNQNKKNIDIIHKEIVRELAAGKDGYNNFTRHPDHDHYTLLQRFLRAQEMFYNKDYKTNAYHFQANYLLSLKQAGVSIETFCKSGEDRTGWMRVTLMAYEEFNKRFHHDPDLTNDIDKSEYEGTLRNAKQLSASLENNHENVKGARGMQLDKDFTRLEENAISKSAGTMAKNLITKAKSIAAWRSKRNAMIGAAVGFCIGLGVVTALTLGTGTIPYLLGTLGVGLLVSTPFVVAACATLVGLITGLHSLVTIAIGNAAKVLSRPTLDKSLPLLERRFGNSTKKMTAGMGGTAKEEYKPKNNQTNATEGSEKNTAPITISRPRKKHKNPDGNSCSHSPSTSPQKWRNPSSRQSYSH